MTGIEVLAALALASAAAGTSAKRVFYRERAEGVHPALVGLLDSWERDGEFAVQVAGGEGWPYPGGLRTDEATQAAAAATGLSAASTLKDTPHGRGAALDVWPMGFEPYQSFEVQPGMRELMTRFGEFAEARGFEWGGRWGKADYPHVQVPGWRSLPFPPPYGGVA
jgi:hypothetical protein